MVAHVENVNLSAIWDMVDKMRVFLFPIRARNCLFSNRSIRSPSPGLPGSACHPASPYSCPCRRTVGPAGSAGCLVRPGFGAGFGGGGEVGSGYELLRRMRRRIRGEFFRRKSRRPKRTRRLWQRVLLIISPIAWTSLKQFVIRIGIFGIL